MVVEKLGRSSVQIRYEGSVRGRPVFKARNTAVTVDMKTFKAMAIPDWLRAALRGGARNEGARASGAMSAVTPHIPMADLRAQYASIRSEVDAAVARVLESAHYIKGEDCAAFEAEFAAYCGASYCAGVANGTDALIVALRAYGVGAGDEVVTVANTFIATGEAILLNGARPVFVDVDALTCTMDPALLERAIGPKAKVIVPVHLYGHPAPMAPILEIAARKGLPVLEDAAQAHGADRRTASARARWATRPASASIRARTSAPSAMRAPSSRATACSSKARARSRTMAAGANRYDNLVLGTNSRLDSLQAAVLRVKLRRLDSWNAERRRLVRALRRAARRASGPRPAAGSRGRALCLAPLHGPGREARRAAAASRGPRHRKRRALPAADPPAAGDGGRRRPARRPAGVRRAVAAGDVAAPLRRDGRGRGAPRLRRSARLHRPLALGVQHAEVQRVARVALGAGG